MKESCISVDGSFSIIFELVESKDTLPEFYMLRRVGKRMASRIEVDSFKIEYVSQDRSLLRCRHIHMIQIRA